MSLLRVLRTVKATLAKTFYLDEVATGASGAVTVSITRQDGTLIESGAATGPDAANTYAWTFGGRDVLDSLVVTWSATVGGDAVVLDQDEIQIVGGFFFGLAEARAFDNAIASTTKYPTADLVERRIEVEDEAERICGQAFVPRFARETVNGTGRTALILKWPLIRAIRAVQVGTVSFSVAQVAAVGFSDAGMVYLSQGWIPGVPIGKRNITIEYEHGWDRPPSNINRAGKVRLKSMLLEPKSALPDRAERVITESDSGTIVYSSPTADKVGIPAVDAIYARYPSPRPGFG